MLIVKTRHALLSILMIAAAGYVVVRFLPAQPPPGSTWEANATLENVRKYTVDNLGAMQGVSFHDGKVYLYGDVYNVQPRVGIVREYTTDYQPTGRKIWLGAEGKPLLRHPTGLTWNKRWGTFLGDTVDQRGVIYRFDWEKALEDGNLDRSVLDVIDDDAAVNGCRPEFVNVNGKALLATADYGNVRPELRLYDPEKLLAAKRSSAPGVVSHRILCGPFNQNLHWDAGRGQIVCVQNAIVGRGWRLDTLDLAKAITDGRAWGPGVRVRLLTFPAKDELEGYRPLDGDRGLFITSSGRDNVTTGSIKELGVTKSAK